MSLIQLAELEQRMRKLERDMDKWKARRIKVFGGGMTQHDQLYNLLKDVHLQYLPLTGERTMTGNLNHGIYRAVFGNAYFEAVSADSSIIRVRKHNPDSDLATIMVDSLVPNKVGCANYEGRYETTYYSSRNLDGGYNNILWMRTRFNGAWLYYLKMDKDGMYMPNLPVADPHIVGALWNNGGVVTVSAG